MTIIIQDEGGKKKTKNGEIISPSIKHFCKKMKKKNPPLIIFKKGALFSAFYNSRPLLNLDQTASPMMTTKRNSESVMHSFNYTNTIA